MTDPIPAVTQVEVLHDFVLGVTFDDGTVGEVDLLPHLWGRVFEPLRDDPELFAQVRVDEEEGRSCGRTARTWRRRCSTGSRPLQLPSSIRGCSAEDRPDELREST